MFKQAPRGYFGREFPRPHNHDMDFAMCAENTTKDSTIVDLFRSDEGLTNPSAVYVNPKHSSFGETSFSSCYPESIIDNMKLTMDISLTKVAKETDKLDALVVNYMPLYFAFEDSLTASDVLNGTEVEDTLLMTHETTDHQATPLYSGTDMPLADTVEGPMPGLTTDQTLESVAFNKDNFYDALQYETHAGMIKKVTGPMRRIVVTPDRPYHRYTNNRIYPSVKRMNPYTFCGILFHCPQSSQVDQLSHESETTDINHILVKLQCRFDEWNSRFNQDSS